MRKRITARKIEPIGFPATNLWAEEEKHGVWNKYKCCHCGLKINVRKNYFPSKCPKCHSLMVKRFVVRCVRYNNDPSLPDKEELYSGKRHKEYVTAEIEECKAAIDVNVFDSWIEEVKA